MNIENLSSLAKMIRYYILKSTSRAGSGHPTSSLSAVELMTGLMFGGVLSSTRKILTTPTTTGSSFQRGMPLPYCMRYGLPQGR